MATIDAFLPNADVAQSHSITIHAPATLVYRIACETDFNDILPVRAIFWLRERILGATARPDPELPHGLVALTKHLGWGVLSETPGAELVMGAVTQPWLADVAFRSVPAGAFAAFAEPDCVKIVWTLEASPIGPAQTLLTTQTRVLATDEAARQRFGRYWRRFGIGIRLIRVFLLPAVRRRAEHAFQQ